MNEEGWQTILNRVKLAETRVSPDGERRFFISPEVAVGEIIGLDRRDDAGGWLPIVKLVVTDKGDGGLEPMLLLLAVDVQTSEGQYVWYEPDGQRHLGGSQGKGFGNEAERMVAYHPTLDECPGEIDFEVSLRLLVDQSNRKDFAKPTLVARV